MKNNYTIYLLIALVLLVTGCGESKDEKNIKEITQLYIEAMKQKDLKKASYYFPLGSYYSLDPAAADSIKFESVKKIRDGRYDYYFSSPRIGSRKGVIKFKRIKEGDDPLYIAFGSDGLYESITKNMMVFRHNWQYTKLAFATGVMKEEEVDSDLDRELAIYIGEKMNQDRGALDLKNIQVTLVDSKALTTNQGIIKLKLKSFTVDTIYNPFIEYDYFNSKGKTCNITIVPNSESECELFVEGNVNEMYINPSLKWSYDTYLGIDYAHFDGTEYQKYPFDEYIGKKREILEERLPLVKELEENAIKERIRMRTEED